MTFKVGDAVMLSSDGNTFDTYHAWADRAAHVPLFTYGGLPVVGKAYRITHVGAHEFQRPNNTPMPLYVLDHEFIVGVTYMHHIKETADGIQSGDTKSGKISKPRTGKWVADGNHTHVSQNPVGFG